MVLESLIIGTIQGITEWLPISSEGMTSIALTQFFGSSFQEAVLVALWLHLGTLLAAAVYFRKDIVQVLKERGEVFWFLVWATVVSLVVAAPLMVFVLDSFVFSGGAVMVLIGALLVITGGMQYVSKKRKPSEKKPGIKDALLTGVAQGFAVLPGLSRSGLTVSALLLRKHKAENAVRLSFLMSIPAVAIGGVWALTRSATFTVGQAVPALGASFVFGLLTIAALLKLAKKVDFSVFVIVIGLLSVVAGFI